MFTDFMKNVPIFLIKNTDFVSNSFPASQHNDFAKKHTDFSKATDRFSETCVCFFTLQFDFWFAMRAIAPGDFQVWERKKGVQLNITSGEVWVVERYRRIIYTYLSVARWHCKLK